MIPIERGAEPLTLDADRTTALSRLRSILQTPRKLVRDDFPVTYKKVGEQLWRRQNHKCCYCELIVRKKGEDVEHFRPASKYWWLAYTWENLLFACKNCNRWGKNDEFPVADETSRLQAEESPPGAEVPMLLDPSVEDPRTSLRFERGPTSGRWRLRGLDERGAITIRVLKLDADDLVELYDHHVSEHVMPKIRDAEEALRDDKPAAFVLAWRDLSVRLVAPTRPFSALSYDIVDHVFPAARRATLGLTLTTR